jgi:hypothetical protein
LFRMPLEGSVGVTAVGNLKAFKFDWDCAHDRLCPKKKPGSFQIMA